MAYAAVSLTGIEFQSEKDYDRVTIDLERLPFSQVHLMENGTRIVLELYGAEAKTVKIPQFNSALIRNVRYLAEGDNLKVYIYLTERADYRVDKERTPPRITVDVLRPAKSSTQTVTPDYSATVDKPVTPSVGGTPTKPLKPSKPGENPDITIREIAPGLTEKIYNHWYDDGPVTAYFLEADKDRYALRPVLARGKVPGRQTLSAMAKANQATAAINASYFALNGEILGVTKINGQVVGTTYFTRTAMGIMPDDSIVFGKVAYDGSVTLGDVTLPVSGVDAERGENGLIIYNRFYGASTGTNEYGQEYVVQNGAVTAVSKANTHIPPEGVVISVHGTSESAFKDVQVGDRAVVYENLSSPWNEALYVLGVGPRLLEKGAVHVTAGEEQFPGDIRYGRAPRTGFGLTQKGNYLFAVVDGRQSISHGCTLTEFAELMKAFGAVEAINFDGGGSSEMIIEGEIVNSPSDGGERAVGTALVLLPRHLVKK
ncbi:MAG: phosphodiester glycosidase family protein [Selenomonadaceae bacterium]|nr:phosphodiester glycosidase family protein [Selenomonadaceae bacterium]